jgi:hypothetical protein
MGELSPIFGDGLRVQAAVVSDWRPIVGLVLTSSPSANSHPDLDAHQNGPGSAQKKRTQQVRRVEYGAQCCRSWNEACVDDQR